MKTLQDSSPGERRRRSAVRDAMRPGVIVVEERAHLAAAAYLMRHSHETALVVTDHVSRLPIATIADTDIAQAVSDGKDINEARVADCVAAGLITVHPDATVDDAVALMVSTGVSYLAVVADGDVVGMLYLTEAHRTRSLHDDRPTSASL